MIIVLFKCVICVMVILLSLLLMGCVIYVFLG